MMRSLWTAASGMISQQHNVDTISNNLANVNTFGYKKERMEFKTLLYDTMQRADLDPANQTGRPVNLQVGLGVRPIAVSRIFSQGNFEKTDYQMDFAIQGDGFFRVQRGEDDIAYTKDGSFKLSPTDDGLMVVSTEGYPILDTNGDTMVFPADVMAKDVVVNEEGLVTYTLANGDAADLGFRMDLVQFSNMQGLEAIGGNMFLQTSASGEPMQEADSEINKLSKIVQGVLEMANVEVANEMVAMIVAQRAYELNSKAIQTSDDMLQLANNLKR